MMYYSKTTGGFYRDSIHTDIPADRVEVTDEQHAALMNAQCEGKVIEPDEDGFPVAVDRKEQPMTPEQQIALLEAAITPRRLRDHLLDQEEPKGWLKAQEDKIAAFRRKLKTDNDNH